MNNLQIFNSEEFGQVRTVTINEEVWMVAKDVAVALGYSNSNDAIVKHVDNEDKKYGVVIRDAMSREQKVVAINESGMYALVFGSKLESAKRFKKWVTSEVLPSIRKTGTYQKPMSVMDQIHLIAQGTGELSERITEVAQDLEDFKNDMPLLAVEIDKITRAKNQKVVPLLGGKHAPAYKNKSIRTKVYKDIESQLWRQFGVKSYKEIKRNQSDVAIEIINCYVLPYVLQQEVGNENAQMCFV